MLIVLYVGSQLGSTLIATATADPNQRRLMLLLPIVFVVILYRYPAGLLVYWITTNLWTIGQQYLIKRRHGRRRPSRARSPPEAANGKPGRAPLHAGARGAGAGAVPRPPAAAARPGRGAPARPPRKKKKRSGRRR